MTSPRDVKTQCTSHTSLLNSHKSRNKQVAAYYTDLQHIILCTNICVQMYTCDSRINRSSWQNTVTGRRSKTKSTMIRVKPQYWWCKQGTCLGHTQLKGVEKIHKTCIFYHPNTILWGKHYYYLFFIFFLNLFSPIGYQVAVFWLSPDISNRPQSLNSAFYKCCMQCSLVWPSVALWPTGDLWATEGSDLIPF